MSKLVKLTSDQGKNIASNSFKCQSDEDIIIEPNSKVSLLNAHISSGILSTYTIKGTDVIAKEAGEIVGSLWLNNDHTQDRERKVLIQEGDYPIMPLLANLANGFNSSLIYNSESRSTAQTSNTLLTPNNPDFGLGVMCDVDDQNDVVISFNSVHQKNTGDLKYSNKSDGIQIDVNGNITYSNPTGTTSLSLDVTQAQNNTKTVVSIVDVPLTTFAQYDSVTLVNSAGNALFETQIQSITPAGFNTDNALGLSPADADDINLIVKTSGLHTNITDAKFKLNDVVTLDNGNGVLGTPSAQTTLAKVAKIDLVPVNANYEITAIGALYGFNTFQNDNIVSVTTTSATEYTLTLDVEFADADDFHIIVNACVYLVDGKGSINCIGEITAVNQDKTDATKTLIDVIVSSYQSKTKIKPSDWKEIGTIEYIYTQENQVAQSVLSGGMQLQVSTDKVALFQGELLNINAKANNKYHIEFAAGSLVCLSDDSTTLLTGLDAYKVLLQRLSVQIPKPQIDYSKILFTSVSSVISAAPLDPSTVPINANDVLEIIDVGDTFDLKCSATSIPQLAQIGADTYSLFNLTYTAASDLENYISSSSFIMTLLNTNFILYKTDATKKLWITLYQVPGVPVLKQATRIWAGQTITETFNIVITTRKANDLTNFDTMIKGTNILPQDLAFCVEDTRLTHSCGRIAFLVNNTNACSFGLMPESSNFNQQVLGNNDLKVIIDAGGNYAVYRGGTRVPLKKNLNAQAGDRVIIQWGVSPSSNDFEYNDAVNGATNPVDIVNNAAAWISPSTGVIDDSDRKKILISVLRQGVVNKYMYLGTADGTTDETARCIPWTPRESPYLPPMVYNTEANLHVFVSPNQNSVRVLELSPDPTIVTLNGVTSFIDGSHVLNDASIHTVTNPDLQGTPSKFTSFNNFFDFVFSNLYIQKQLGFKKSTNPITALKGSWSADIAYPNAYLPENLVILLDCLGQVQTYDLGKTSGTRRNIIGVCVNTQQLSGEINVEPNNLYKIQLNNRTPVNLRKFTVSFENFYGEEVVLQSARAVVNLLIDPPS